MHIAIDASRTTVTRATGTERYALEVIRAIVQQNSNHQITLYFRDKLPADLLPPNPLVKQRAIPFRCAWSHLRFAAALWQDRPDVTFVPAHTLPLAFPGRAVVTVHDLGYKHFPQSHPVRSRLYLDWTTRFSANRATIVLADSQATVEDLHRFYGTAYAKTRVVYPGVQPPIQSRAQEVREKYGLPSGYFLFLGTLQPRKNIARIVQAYTRYRQRAQNPAELVLAGKKGWMFDEGWVQGVEGVHITGYVDENDKGALYAGAEALVFTTLYEGFGFPVLEAMHCGTPVIASTTSSLPELVGDAGLLVNPLDVEAIAAAMLQIDQNEALSKTLRERGYRQTERFSWTQAGEQALNALEEAAR